MLKKTISFLSVLIIVLEPTAFGSFFGKDRISSCEVQKSLVNIDYYLTNSYFSTEANAQQVDVYLQKQKEVIDFQNQTATLLNELQHDSSIDSKDSKELNQKKLIDNLYTLIMLSGEFIKQLPFPKDLKSSQNQKLGGDISNLNQLIITAVGTRACLNK